jgi:hypothetical protein
MDPFYRLAANETASESVTVRYIWAMTAADLCRPEQWDNFFHLVGTGALTLTGLIFVAMSLNLRVPAVDATHGNRAILQRSSPDTTGPRHPAEPTGAPLQLAVPRVVSSVAWPERSTI